MYTYKKQLVFKNRNFRGLGEKLEFMIAQKGGLEEGMHELEPTIMLKWKDCNIGKSSSITASFEHTGFMEYLGNIYKHFITERHEVSLQRSPIIFQKSSLTLQG